MHIWLEKTGKLTEANLPEYQATIREKRAVIKAGIKMDAIGHVAVDYRRKLANVPATEIVRGDRDEVFPKLWKKIDDFLLSRDRRTFTAYRKGPLSVRFMPILAHADTSLEQDDAQLLLRGVAECIEIHAFPERYSQYQIVAHHRNLGRKI